MQEVEHEVAQAERADEPAGADGGGKLRCPHCDLAFDAHTPVPSNDDGGPEVGSVSICIRCAGISLFARDLRGHWALRAPDRVRLAELLVDPDVRRALAALAAAKRAPRENLY